MDQRALFADYKIKMQHKKLQVKGEFAYEGLEVFGFFVLNFILPVLIWYLPLGGSIVITVIKIISMVFSFFFTKRLVHDWISPVILEIDIAIYQLLSPLDKIQINLSDIKEVIILEEILQNQETEKEVKQYRLKFFLMDQELTSVFAFTSYNKLLEIKKLIKE